MIQLPEEVDRFYKSGIEFIRYDNGKVLPVVRGGAFGDDDADAEDDTEESESETDNDDEDESDDEKEDELDPKDRRIKELSNENGRWRRKLRTERQAHEATKSELEKVRKNGTSDEKLKSENASLQQQVEKLTEQNNTLRVVQEVHKHITALSLNPSKVKAILRVMDMEDIDVDEDGVSGVREALEDIAREYPEWVTKASGNGDKDDDANENGRPGGQSSRKPGKAKGTTPDRNALLSAYPALQQGFIG